MVVDYVGSTSMHKYKTAIISQMSFRVISENKRERSFRFLEQNKKHTSAAEKVSL